AFIEKDHVVGVQLGQQVTQGGGAVAHLAPAIGGVEITREGSAGDAELALAQLLLQPRWICWKVAEGAELDRVVVGLSDFVEEAVPGRLTLVGWEPHAPRVGRGTNVDGHGNARVSAGSQSGSETGYSGGRPAAVRRTFSA